MEIRRGILGGTTLLFAMAGAACPDTADGGDASVTTDITSDMTADQVGGDNAPVDNGTPDQGTPDTVADVGSPDVGVDTQATDTPAGDTPIADTTIADSAGDTVMGDGGTLPDGVMSDGGKGDATGIPDVVMADTKSDGTTIADSMADTKPDAVKEDGGTSADTKDDAVCQEPTATPAELVGHPCDQPWFQALCDEQDPTLTAVYCDGSGVWVVPVAGDFCSSCWAVDCDWDQTSCVAIGYVGINRAGFVRSATRRLRQV